MSSMPGYSRMPKCRRRKKELPYSAKSHFQGGWAWGDLLFSRSLQKAERKQCYQGKEQSVNMSDCQQDPWKLEEGPVSQWAIPPCLGSRLSLPDSSISALKEETDTQTMSSKCSSTSPKGTAWEASHQAPSLWLRAVRRAVGSPQLPSSLWPLGEQSPPLLCSHILQSFQMPSSPRKPSDVDSGPTTGVNSQDLGFIHVCNTYLLNEWLCHGQSSCYRGALLERCLIKIWEGIGNTTL